MQMNTFWIAGFAMTAAGLMTAGAAHAAAWVPPSGSTAAFTYSNGGDDYGRFGNPVVSATGFTFVPTNFQSSSSNNNSGVTSDRAYVNLDATPASGGITSVKLNELGDYSILNGGGAYVSAYVLVHVYDTVWSGSRDVYATLTPTPAMPVIGGTTSGAWSGTATVTLPVAAQHVQLVFNDILQTYANAGGTSFIQKKLADVTIGVKNVAVPEPTSAVAMLGAAVLVIRRKRQA